MSNDPLSAALAEIREREHKASPGPWKVEVEHGHDIDGAPWRLPSVTGPDGKDVILSGHVDDPVKDLKFAAHARTDIPLLLAAVDAVLADHPLTKTVRYAKPCTAHAYTLIGARKDCPDCVQVEYHDGCKTCRDEFGIPVRPEDCRARKSILAALTGQEAPRE